MKLSLKSQVRFARSIFEALFSDIASGRPNCVVSSLQRDFQTLASRLDSEGLAFVTVTLPCLSKAVIASFRTGSLQCPSSFRRKKGTSLPSFLSGLMEEIYTLDGNLLPQPSVASITEVLQVCGLGYKLNVPFRDSQNQKVVDDFLQTESDLSDLEASFLPDFLTIEYACSVIEDIFSGFDPSLGVPRHGPGTVATGERGHKKWNFKRKFLKVHRVFPYYEYFVVNRSHLFDQLKWYKALTPEASGTAKVSLVPKDSRGPRLISAEPLEYQFIQQSVWQGIGIYLETHPLTRRRINFKDQSVNQDLALLGSRDGSWATLDMKEASDRVSCLLVAWLFRRVPKVRDALFAVRSDSTLLPNGTVVPLRKFAPMGSAICFPVESVVHFALAVASIVRYTDLTREAALEKVRVYGDDLIVATPYANLVMECFPQFGLRFNPDKCFICGPFRESCGTDAFKGVKITPVRWRKPWSQRLDAVTAQAFCSFASQLYCAGYLQAANLVWMLLERQVGVLPTVPYRQHRHCLGITTRYEDRMPEVGYMSRITRHPYYHTPYKVRSNLAMQRIEHWCLKIHVVEKQNTTSGWSRLLCYLCYRGAKLEPNEEGSLVNYFLRPSPTSAAALNEVTVYTSHKRRWMSIR